jgi:hypothetical protein
MLNEIVAIGSTGISFPQTSHGATQISECVKGCQKIQKRDLLNISGNRIKGYSACKACRSHFLYIEA